MKRFFSVLMVLVLCFSFVLAGCGSADKEQQSSAVQSTSAGNSTSVSASADSGTPGQLPIVKDKITLSVFVAEPGNVIDLATNKFALWAEEKTNIKIDWQVGGEEAYDKLNLMLSSGAKLPDIIGAELSNAQQLQYGQEGIIIPVNDYIDKFSVNFKKMLEDTQNGGMITAPDGNIYGVSKYEDCYQCMFAQKMWINQAWLDKLKLKMPATTDEFYNVLKAFKTEDPNGNGKADEVPMSGAIDGWHSNLDRFTMNAFIYNDGGNRLNLVDGKVIPAFTQQEWKDGLSYFRKLYQEELVDSEIFVQNLTQLKQLVENGDAVKLGASPGGISSLFAAAEGTAIKDYVCVPPLTGPKGLRTATYYPPELSNRTFITRDCANPEAAFKWLDFLLSEEATLRQACGEEGVDWRYAKEGEVGLDGKPAFIKIINNLPEMSEQNQGVELLCNITNRISEGKAVDPALVGQGANYNEETKKYDGLQPKELFPALFMNLEDSQRTGELGGAINTYVNESFAKFVTGEMDIEKDWSRYLQELDSLGLKEYVEINQRNIDSIKK